MAGLKEGLVSHPLPLLKYNCVKYRNAVMPNGIDPSPENQLFAIAQSDFLPSPVGRGCMSEG